MPLFAMSRVNAIGADLPISMPSDYNHYVILRLQDSAPTNQALGYFKPVAEQQVLISALN